MRGTTAALVVALALIPIGSELHAAARDLMIKLSGGVSMPIDDFEDLARRGFIGGVDFDYLATESVALGLNVSFVSHHASAERESTLAGEAGVPVRETLTMLPVGLHVKLLSATSRFSPYVVLGIGAYSLTETQEGPGDPTPAHESETKLGARAGLGFMVRMSGQVGLAVEGVYHYVDTKVVSPSGDLVRPSTQVVGIQAGVTYSLATSAR